MAAVDLDAFAAAIRLMESGSTSGNYKAASKSSSARGAYQYVKGTWGGYGGYASADQAPPAVQDAKFKADAARFAKKYNGDVSLMAMAHFQGEGAADETARGSKKWITAKDANGMASNAYMQRILNTYKKVSGQTSIGGNVDRSQIDFGSVPAGGSSMSTAVPQVDMMTMLAQAMGLGQQLQTPVPSYDAYAQQMAALRQQALMDQINQLDLAVEQAMGNIKGNTATSQADVATIGAQAARDYQAILAKFGQGGSVAEQQGTQGGLAASLASQGIDPAAFLSSAQGALGGVQAGSDLGGQTLAQMTATSGDINALLQQMLTGTRDAGLANVQAAKLQASTNLRNQSAKDEQTFLQRLIEAKYGAELQKDPAKVVLDLLQVMGNVATNNQQAAVQMRGQDVTAEGNVLSAQVQREGQANDRTRNTNDSNQLAESKRQYDLSLALERDKFDAEVTASETKEQTALVKAQTELIKSGKGPAKTADERTFSQILSGQAAKNASFIKQHGNTVVNEPLNVSVKKVASAKDAYEPWLLALSSPSIPLASVEQKLREFWTEKYKKLDKTIRAKSVQSKVTESLREVRKLRGEFIEVNGRDVPLTLQQQSLLANGNAMVGPDPFASPYVGTEDWVSGRGASSPTSSNPSIFG